MGLSGGGGAGGAWPGTRRRTAATDRDALLPFFKFFILRSNRTACLTQRGGPPAAGSQLRSSSPTFTRWMLSRR